MTALLQGLGWWAFRLWVWWILINVHSRQNDAVVRVLLQLQHAVCFLDEVSMGNSPDHLIDCVDIVRIPSHEPKKVFQCMRAQSIECQMAVIAQGKKNKKTVFKKRATHSDVKIVRFPPPRGFSVFVSTP